MTNQTRKLLLGLFILLLVDVIWVSSSELTKYLYHDESFEKPFFSTYIKTSMFAVYLFGLCLYPPWKDYCHKPAKYTQLPEVEDENIEAPADNGLSPPIYIPIKWEEKQEKCSGSESDDASIKRAVKFCKLAEVRHMSDSNANDAFWARLSYHASVKASQLARRAGSKFSIEQVAKISAYFFLLWFISHYTSQAAKTYTDDSLVSLLTTSSSIFTLALAAIFPSNGTDKFTISKFFAVLLSAVGLVIITFTHSPSLEIKKPLGVILSLISAFFFSCYVVILCRVVNNDEKMEIPVFLGFIGLFNMLLLWPLFFLLHFLKLEVFEWPTKYQWTVLLINGLVGTVLSEALWLWGCLLTSSLIANLALGLTIPLAILADTSLTSVIYTPRIYIGSIPIIISFLFVTFSRHYDNTDPLGDRLKQIFRSQEFKFSEAELEQRESLIKMNDDHEA